MIDSEDGPKGFGAHSDQERILEESLRKLRDNNVPVQFIAYPVAGHSPGDPVLQQDVNRR